MIKVGIGSTNPVKVKAVQNAVQKVWQTAVFAPISAPSGVSDMPMSDEETLLGATNRARVALAGADFGIGMEGGVHEEPFGLMLMGWVVVMDKNGRLGISGTNRIMLPETIANRVRAGELLGSVIDDLLHTEKTNQKGGAFGALTDGLVTRGDVFETAVCLALAPFITPKLYGKTNS